MTETEVVQPVVVTLRAALAHKQAEVDTAASEAARWDAEHTRLREAIEAAQAELRHAQTIARRSRRDTLDGDDDLDAVVQERSDQVGALVEAARAAITSRTEATTRRNALAKELRACVAEIARAERTDEIHALRRTLPMAGRTLQARAAEMRRVLAECQRALTDLDAAEEAYRALWAHAKAFRDDRQLAKTPRVTEFDGLHPMALGLIRTAALPHLIREPQQAPQQEPQ